MVTIKHHAIQNHIKEAEEIFLLDKKKVMPVSKQKPTNNCIKAHTVQVKYSQPAIEASKKRDRKMFTSNTERK